MKHNWMPKKPNELTLLTFHDIASDTDLEIWVHENENLDLDVDGKMECFRTDGTQILIDRERDVHVYRKVCRKWYERNPSNPTARQLETGIAAQRQRTTFELVRIGVQAAFKPVYGRSHVTNG